MQERGKEGEENHTKMMHSACNISCHNDQFVRGRGRGGREGMHNACQGNTCTCTLYMYIVCKRRRKGGREVKVKEQYPLIMTNTTRHNHKRHI